ncbi:hypothetical protein E1B28_009664 [Marasmius oreades]|uniref:Uncharacterized protein n=1 Tax=Marasmius oreades TaxID=181124 RepID=A0A9P7URX6_9AGAR|nr:uncharacterized protein E1B28_009664 [Marasmius oreades]KAG7090556.1 hypothetical protein E1B28_009664 [Marasmius oreades]
MITSNYLVEQFTSPASGIARRTRTRTKTGPPGNTLTGSGRVSSTESSALIPKLAKRGSETQRVPSSIPQTQTQKALSKRTPGVGDFLKVPEQPLNSSFKSRVVDREKKPHRFQAEASKENVIGDKLKKGDGVKGEKGTKTRELPVPATSTISQNLTLPGSFAPLDVKPLKIAKWPGSRSTITSLQPGFSSEVSTYHASSSKTRVLSERDKNLPQTPPIDAGNISPKLKEHTRSPTTTPSSTAHGLPKGFTSIATTHTVAPPIPVSTRVPPHHKSSSLGGIFHRRSFWPREVADLASTKRRNRHATACSLDVITTTTEQPNKRRAIYSPPSAPSALTPGVSNTDGFESIVRAYRNSIKLSPLTVVPLALVTSRTRTDTEGEMAYHPIVKELLNEVDEALRSWNPMR